MKRNYFLLSALALSAAVITTSQARKDGETCQMCASDSTHGERAHDGEAAIVNLSARTHADVAERSHVVEVTHGEKTHSEQVQGEETSAEKTPDEKTHSGMASGILHLGEARTHGDVTEGADVKESKHDEKTHEGSKGLLNLSAAEKDKK